MTTTPLPLEEDAELRAVECVGRREIWAAGQQGVIWHSSDGGATWDLQRGGRQTVLRSLCFLTNQVGWAAGGDVEPYTSSPRGVLLFTQDGGMTWAPVQPGSQRLDAALAKRRSTSPRRERDPSDALRDPLAARDTGRPPFEFPPLHGVRFFSPDDGLVWGESSDQCPNGLLRTRDGGRTWIPLQGPATDGWQAVAFSAPELAAAVGPQGRLGLLVGDEWRPSRLQGLGLRQLHGISLNAQGMGWLVGDGGLLLRTRDSGLVWSPPPTALPETTRSVFDFRAVTARGTHVWAAGEPGSIVWHSPDDGRTWERQATGQPLPIWSLSFADTQRGVAVGALGLILTTADGGQSWNIQRGAGRRLAYLAWQADCREGPWLAMAQLSGENGYRGRVEVLARPDLGPADLAERRLPERLEQAATLLGGSGASHAWQFPAAIPGLERNEQRLVEEWNRRTEGRLAETLAGRLVRQIRMWRPHVVLLQQPRSDEALLAFLNRAVADALQAAADPTAIVEQRELAQLDAWKVDRAFVRLPSGSAGPLAVEPYEYLPRLGKAAALVAAPARSLLVPDAGRTTRETYRPVALDMSIADRGTGSALQIFRNLSIPPGSAARRELMPLDPERVEAELARVTRQRHFSAVIDRSLGQPREAAQLIAQLGQVMRNWPETEAAAHLLQLADAYRAAGRWDLAEDTLSELHARFPDLPAGQQGALRLVQMWCSAEATWRRLQLEQAEHRHVASSEADPQAKLRQVQARLTEQSADEAPAAILSEQTFAPIGGLGEAQRLGRGDLGDRWRARQERGLRLVDQLLDRSPLLARRPEVQFSLAAVARQRGVFARADEVYRRHSLSGISPQWSRTAEAEVWLTQPVGPHAGPQAFAEQASARPHLDGLLSEPCWESAQEIPLRGEAGTLDEERHSLVLLCYDASFLYVALSVPRAPESPRPELVRQGRRHDMDLRDFDRVSLFLDVDRDYQTTYRLTVDERGCTEEACCGDATWNPKWFVATDADESHWRAECAIPLAELVPQGVRRDQVWALGLVRIVPGIQVETWTQPPVLNPIGASLGLLRFD